MIFLCLQCISRSLFPSQFCMRLLDFMMSCSMAEKSSIMNAFLVLVQQKVLDKDTLSNKLLLCLKNCIHKNMVNHIVIVEYIMLAMMLKFAFISMYKYRKSCNTSLLSIRIYMNMCSVVKGGPAFCWWAAEFDGVSESRQFWHHFGASRHVG